MLFGQLVCYGCSSILTYPLGAITCRCCLCNTLNAAQTIQISCEMCGQELHAPINTVTFLCPCCATVTDIPEDLLPPLPSCIRVGDDTDEKETVIYVSHPTLPSLARAESEASANTTHVAASQGDQAGTYVQGQQSMDSPGRLDEHLSYHEANTAPDSAKGNFAGSSAFDTRDAEGAHTADGTRIKHLGPSTPGERHAGAAVSDMSSAARPETLTRLAPAFMIATRIL